MGRFPSSYQTFLTPQHASFREIIPLSAVTSLEAACVRHLHLLLATGKLHVKLKISISQRLILFGFQQRRDNWPSKITYCLRFFVSNVTSDE